MFVGVARKVPELTHDEQNLHLGVKLKLNNNLTEFPIPSFIEVFWLSFREFPRLVGCYCS